MALADEIKQIQEEAIGRIKAASDLQGLEEIRVQVLGKKGSLTSILKQMGGLSAEERPRVGQVANEARQSLESSLASKKEKLRTKELHASLKQERVDITLPPKMTTPLGSKHIISQIIDEIVDVFIPMGYSVAEGPEVELDYYNFTALNTPPGHPARSLHDTFYVDIYDSGLHEPFTIDKDQILLRTHTSPVQVRVMKSQEPPVYVVCPGKAFRRDVADPSHSPMFHQIEGLAVDKNITFGDLKGTLELFAKRVFGSDRNIRMRPHFFPFTEPSAEIDVSCIICGGSGCRVCSHTGWLEILGAGMVDPNVLKEAGYDPEEVSGFAFGMGVERIAMLKYGITDIRMFFENDLRFLEQM